MVSLRHYENLSRVDARAGEPGIGDGFVGDYCAGQGGTDLATSSKGAIGGVSDIAEVLGFFVRTGVLPALAVGLVASVVVTAVALRRGWLTGSAWLAFAAVLSVSGVLAFTLLRESVLIAQDVASGTPLVVPGWHGLSSWSPNGWWRATADPLRSTQVLLNIALFVPAGFLGTVITRRPLRVLAALAGLSVAIEVIQAVSGLGAADVADIIANVAGAALGTGAAVLAGWAGDAVASRAVGTRRWVLRGSTVAVATVCVAMLPGLGATARQAALAEQARQSFDGTVLADVHQWERDDELDRMWRGVPPAYSDGFTLDAESATARYPARFLGRRTCILVTWDTLGVQTHPASGEVCERTSLSHAASPFDLRPFAGCWARPDAARSATLTRGSCRM